LATDLSSPKLFRVPLMKHEIVTGLRRASNALYDVESGTDRLQIPRKQVGSAMSSLLLGMAIHLLTSVVMYVLAAAPPVYRVRSHGEDTTSTGSFVSKI